jgi:hypothetical protein
VFSTQTRFVCCLYARVSPTPPRAAISRSRSPPLRRARRASALSAPSLSEADKALRAAARRQGEARRAPAAAEAEAARLARRCAEESASAAARGAAAAREEAGLAAVAATQRRVRQSREAASLAWFHPEPPVSPEQAALRAALANAAQPLTALRLWSFAGPPGPPTAAALPPGRRTAVGIFLHSGVAVTVTPLAAGRPGLPLPPRVRLPGVADRADGDRV